VAKKKPFRFGESSKCRFCRDKVAQIDYKDVAALQKLVSSQGKLFARKRSGNCAYHQRAARRAVKRARFMALMPFVG
jgi:small subunit ribosomal protein S18